MKASIKLLFGIVSVFLLGTLVLANVPELTAYIADTMHVSVDTLTHYVKWFGGASAFTTAIGYYPTGCDGIVPDHNCDPCAEREYGRIRSAGFIHKDFEFADGDTTNTTEWQRGINEGKIIVIPETNGEFPEPSEKVGPGYGDTTETLLGFDFSANFVDPNYKENCDFYNALIGNRNYKFFYRTSSQTHITDKSVTIIPKKSIQNDLTSEVTWKINVKWMSNQFPCPFNTPESVFTCFMLEE